MAENAYLDDGGLQQVTSWLRWKDVGEHQEGYYTSEIFNDYENNIALGPYNHIEGGNNIIADTTDKYYAYAGNPFLDIPSDIKLINLVENSSNYHINSEQGIFSLENIELPEIFTVNNYAEDININEYDYIQKDNKWYPIQQSEIDLVNYQNIENMLSDIFGKANTISSVKIFSSAEEPTIPTENLILYNSLAYYREKTYNLSAEEITLLTSINTLEIQDNNYITTIYLNESNNFGFVYIMDTNEDENIEEDIIEDEEAETTTDILAEDNNTEDTNNEEQGPTSGDYFSSHSLLINQYDKDNILSIENLTNQIGNFQLINQVYLPHPSAATKENAVYGTDITGIAEYGNQTNLNWEYLNNYDIQLELQPIARELDEEENEINPLKVEVNSTTLVNATIDYAQDSLIFSYQEEIDDTGIITSQKWYLYDEEVNLSTYGITVANAENGDSFTIYLNKEYISDNEVLTQSEFYERNHAAGIETYIFQGNSQKWIKKKPDEKVGNEGYCYNHIEGYNNQVKGAYNHAEGMDNIISSSYYPNHIEGYSNKILGGTFNHVQGHGCINENGSWNFLGGMFNRTVGGNYSFIFGYSNNNNGGESNTTTGQNNTIESCIGSFVTGQGNNLQGGFTSFVAGWNNIIKADECSIISGCRNQIGSTSEQSYYYDSVNNIICGNDNTIEKGSNNIITGNNNTLKEGRNNLIISQYSEVTGTGNIVNNDNNSSILSGDFNLFIGKDQNCSGSCNLIGGGYSNINGDSNITAGFGQNIVGSSNTALNSWNTVKGDYNFAIGNYNNIEGNLQNLLGNHLIHNQSNKSATIIGEFNQDTKTFFLTSDTTIQDDKIYSFDSKGQNQIIVKSSKPSSPKDYYELDSSGEYVKTTDTEWIEGKKYYNQNGDRMFFTGDTIDETLYEESYHLFIAGNGIYGKRSNALELDYRGNLNTSGDIVNGDGVIVGASISNDVLDNIWNEVFS